MNTDLVRELLTLEYQVIVAQEKLDEAIAKRDKVKAQVINRMVGEI